MHRCNPREGIHNGARQTGKGDLACDRRDCARDLSLTDCLDRGPSLILTIRTTTSLRIAPSSRYILGVQQVSSRVAIRASRRKLVGSIFRSPVRFPMYSGRSRVSLLPTRVNFAISLVTTSSTPVRLGSWTTFLLGAKQRGL